MAAGNEDICPPDYEYSKCPTDIPTHQECYYSYYSDKDNRVFDCITRGDESRMSQFWQETILPCQVEVWFIKKSPVFIFVRRQIYILTKMKQEFFAESNFMNLFGFDHKVELLLSNKPKWIKSRESRA